jgi:predicted nucleic acid binding AN1-type Zn finger protein
MKEASSLMSINNSTYKTLGGKNALKCRFSISERTPQYKPEKRLSLRLIFKNYTMCFRRRKSVPTSPRTGRKNHRCDGAFCQQRLGRRTHYCPTNHAD